jgi:predicted sulfurtransferase
MRNALAVLLWMTVGICSTGADLSTAYGADDTERMTREELKGRLGDPDVIIVDVRAEGSWKGSASKIRGAVREDPTGVERWMKNYSKDKTLVFYCS